MKKDRQPSARQKALSGMPAIQFKTSDMRSMLREMHPSGEWALMEEVAPRTGGGTRYADAVAVNLWKSRGYAVHGFEIKVSRADWMRELKNPAKADEVFGYCDHWWVVAAPGIVRPEELPAGWGLLEPARKRGKGSQATMAPDGDPAADASDPIGTSPVDLATKYRLATVVRAEKLDAKPLSREFFASLVRRSHEVIDQIAREQSMDAVRKVEATVGERVEAEIARRSQRFGKMEEQIRTFEKETGLKMSPWNGPPVETILLAQQLEKFKGYGARQELFASLTRMAENLEKSAKDVRDAVKTMNEQLLPQKSPGAADGHANDFESKLGNFESDLARLN